MQSCTKFSGTKFLGFAAFLGASCTKLLGNTALLGAWRTSLVGVITALVALCTKLLKVTALLSAYAQVNPGKYSIFRRIVHKIPTNYTHCKAIVFGTPTRALKGAEISGADNKALG